MAISVMIQRTFSDKEKAVKLAPLIVKLRSLATIQPGYITGKTFGCLDCPGEYLVISTLKTGTAGCKVNNAWHFKNRSMIYWAKQLSIGSTNPWLVELSRNFRMWRNESHGLHELSCKIHKKANPVKWICPY
jgi:hypothetical protein